MKEIIQVNASSGLGGGPKIMWYIIKGLKDSVDFSVLTPKGKFFEKYKKLNIDVEELSGFLKIWRIRQKIKDANIDIIHAHGTRAAFWGRLALVGLREKPQFIYTLHGFHIIRRCFLVKWILVIAEKLLNNWTDVLVCVSNSDKELVKKYNVISEEKIEVIENGIALRDFAISKKDVEEAREALGVKKDFVITTVSRLHPPKDITTVIKGFNIFLNNLKSNRATLLIVGDGPLRDKLEKQVRELRMNDYVKFLGFREDVSLIINLSDVVVLSTEWEGLPLIPLEAGASKEPVVASGVGGVKETIKDEETGLLFEKGNAKELAEKIIKLYSSESLRKELGQSAYKFVSENFSVERMVNDYKQLYNEMI